MTCWFCKKVVDPKTAYTRIEGWQRKTPGPSRKGGSDIVLRKKKEFFACWSCIERQKRGLSVRQEELS